MENDIHVALWQALGADAAPMAWGDAFTAMQQGALDGQENPLVLLETNGVPEINKHATKTEHIYNCTITLMSQKLWNEMSEEDRQPDSGGCPRNPPSSSGKSAAQSMTAWSSGSRRKWA